MIGYLQGVILNLNNDHILLNVNGVGYKVYLPTRLLANIAENDKVSFFIHTAVKEDDISLFGFLSGEDKKVFLELNKVSGVGAKTALAILGLMTATEIIDAISFEDKAALTRVSGIGPKAALRIINDLKDRIGKINIGVINTVSSKLETKALASNHNNLLRDALSALENLGYQRASIINIVKDITKEESDLSSVITQTLKKLAK